MIQKKRWYFFVIPLIVWLVSACSHSKKLEETELNINDRTQIVTSIFPVYEIVREIAGEQADVHLMVGSGEDAHHYEPSAKAIALVNEADVFIYSGEEMEYWAADLVNVVENEHLSILQLGANIDMEIITDDSDGNDAKVDDHGHNHGELDPHFWLNPLAVSQQIPQLIKMLGTVDPDGKTIYDKNGTELIARLEKLDQDFVDSFAKATQRDFVVQHKAFGHLANQYHLNQLSVGGLSTEVEPNPKDLIKIIEFVKKNNTEVIFYQHGNTSAVAATIARETGAEIAVLYDLENKPAGIETEGNYYFKAMYHNLEELKKVIY